MERDARRVSELRAGGTDVQDRFRRQLLKGPFRDLAPTAERTAIASGPTGARIGALVRLQTIANDPRLIRSYPAFAAAAGDLATPQVRAVATCGGALLQRSRCWYYRQPAFDCYRKGGDACPARGGDHRYGVVIDLGPCIAAHPATMGVALAAYDGVVETESGRMLTTNELYGDGRDPSRDHQLDDDEVLAAVILPPPSRDERGAYKRAISRALAEWPLVEVAVRLQVEDDRIVRAAVAAGAVANIPIRVAAVENALLGRRTADAPAASEATHVDGRVIPDMAYKLDLLKVLIGDVITAAVSADRTAAAPTTFAPALAWVVD